LKPFDVAFDLFVAFINNTRKRVAAGFFILLRKVRNSHVDERVAKFFYSLKSNEMIFAQWINGFTSLHSLVFIGERSLC
jgi:hypothetical protein